METTKKPMRIFGLHVLSDVSKLGEKTVDMQDSIRYNICSLGFKQCFAARDPYIFDIVCQGNFDSCQNHIDDSPVSEKDFVSSVYAVQFYTKRGAIVLSGAGGGNYNAKTNKKTS